jgi:hypothetical protein
MSIHPACQLWQALQIKQNKQLGLLSASESSPLIEWAVGKFQSCFYWHETLALFAQWKFCF